MFLAATSAGQRTALMWAVSNWTSGIEAILEDRLTLAIGAFVRVDTSAFIAELGDNGRWVRDAETLRDFSSCNFLALGEEIKEASFLTCGFCAIHIILNLFNSPLS